MSRDLQHRVHTILRTAVVMFDLPLDDHHVERLAVEATPAVKALIAEALDGQAQNVPVRYAVVRPTDEQAAVETTQYAGCVSRISVEVDLDSPAACLATELRRHHDVIATDVPTGSYLGLTVRPATAEAWRWWLRTLAISEDKVTVQGTNAYAVGEKDGVAVHLCGDDTALLLPGGASARPGLDIDLDSPAGTVAAKARRQPDVTAIEIRDAHTLTVTVRATSLVEWQWWLKELAVAPDSVAFEGATAIVTGRRDGATVHLHGDGCRAFYTEDMASARLMGLIAETSPGRP